MAKRSKGSKNFGWFKARKDYECDLTSRKIKVGDDYYRINLPYSGILHFHKSCKKADIDAYVADLIDDAAFDLDFMDCPVHTASDDSEVAHMAMLW